MYNMMILHFGFSLSPFQTSTYKVLDITEENLIHVKDISINWVGVQASGKLNYFRYLLFNGGSKH